MGRLVSETVPLCLPIEQLAPDPDPGHGPCRCTKEHAPASQELPVVDLGIPVVAEGGNIGFGTGQQAFVRPAVMLAPVPLRHQFAVTGVRVLKHTYTAKYEHHANRYCNEHASTRARMLRQRPMPSSIPIMPTHTRSIQQRSAASHQRALPAPGGGCFRRFSPGDVVIVASAWGPIAAVCSWLTAPANFAAGMPVRVGSAPDWGCSDRRARAALSRTG